MGNKGTLISRASDKRLLSMFHVDACFVRNLQAGRLQNKCISQDGACEHFVNNICQLKDAPLEKFFLLMLS